MIAILLIPVIYLIVETILGYRRGLVRSLLLFVSWIVSLAGAALLVREFVLRGNDLPQLTGIFEDYLGPELSVMASMVFLFVLLLIMIKIFCNIIIHFLGIISNIPIIGTADKILGGLFGFLKGAIVVALAFLIYSVYNGTYVDILWKEIPQVMIFIEQMKEYLQQLWSAF